MRIEDPDGGWAEHPDEPRVMVPVGPLGAAGRRRFRLAAEGGLAKAQVYLGNSYDYARFGLAEDDVTALEWYRRAADQGDEAGNIKVGEFYENAYVGLDHDEEKAKEFYAKGEILASKGGERFPLKTLDHKIRRLGTYISSEHAREVREGLAEPRDINLLDPKSPVWAQLVDAFRQQGRERGEDYEVRGRGAAGLPLAAADAAAGG
jgi:hypothetical protein